jgi:hypothetical protein
MSPQALATSWSKETLKPALEKAAGRDGKLSATEAARAGGEVEDVYVANGMKTPSVSTLTKKGEALLLKAAKAAAGADGLLSASESRGVAQKFSIDFNTLAPVPWVAEPEKIKDIAAHFEAHPGQKFVLFGDTKHRDPEVYREIVKRYPDRVIGVFINDVKTIPASRTDGFHLIKNYAEAAGALYKSGALSKDAARAVMISARSEGLAITDAQINALLG